MEVENIKANKAIELQVKGMTCTNCALGIEKYLEKEGLERVQVDFTSGEVLFETDKPQMLKKWVKGIEKLGFEVADAPETESQGLSKVEKYFLFSLVFTLPLILHMFIKWAPLHNPLVQLILCLPVFLVGMWYFGRSALNSLRAGVPNMDVLISMGSIAAFGYSLYGYLLNLGPDFLFFETAATIITLVLLGNVIEHRSVQRTTASIRELQDLQPKVALRKNEEGSWENIPFANIQRGDHLRIPNGERIPVDGRVMSGEAELDEAVLTGEGLPQKKGLGDRVLSGTLVVEGQLDIEAEQVGKSSTLSQIIDLVKKAQSDKPNIQRLADKISAIFVPVVIGVAILTFLLSWSLGVSLTQSLVRAIAVLVIACPCAMGLATPTAVVVGIGRASRKGILIKGGRILEQFSEIKQIVFDKTGTLTTGNFQLNGIQVQSPSSLKEVRSVIKSLEEYSSHPIGKSLVEALSDVQSIELQNVMEVKGVGLSGADLKGNSYQIGSYRIAQGLVSEDDFSLYLLKNGEFWAGIRLDDEIRAGAKETIAFLKENGITPILLSGDKQGRCEDLAEKLGIEEVYGDQLPDQKLAKVEELSRKAPTAMIGDGINDAPALAKAHVGISLSEATEIAQQSAQVVLLQGGVSLIRDLFQISRHTLRTIKQNLFWAFFYNVLMIPMAALGFLKPMLAALSMAFSDVFVIGNSIRLRFKKLS